MLKAWASVIYAWDSPFKGLNNSSAGIGQRLVASEALWREEEEKVVALLPQWSPGSGVAMTASLHKDLLAPLLLKKYQDISFLDQLPTITSSKPNKYGHIVSKPAHARPFLNNFLMEIFLMAD